MKLKLFTFAVVYWILIIFVAHFFPPPGYDWTQNTISDLASQGHRYKWIMQLGLSGFGGLVVLAVIRTMIHARRMIPHSLPIALYGFTIFLSGIYCTTPINPSLSYSLNEAKLHSLFATVAGISLSLAIFWRIQTSKNRRELVAHILFFTAVIGFSALFGLAENQYVDVGMGIVQRLLYISGFVWLVYQERLSSMDEAYAKQVIFNP